MNRAIHGQGDFELDTPFQSFYVAQSVWSAKSHDQKGRLYNRLLASRQFSVKYIQSTDGKLEVPNVNRLARKPGQRHRPKTTAARTMPRYSS